MTILRLHSLADQRLKVFTGLTNHQLRNSLDPSRGIVIVESEIAIRVALQQGLSPVSFLLSEGKAHAMQDVLKDVDNDVPVFILDEDLAEELTGYRVTRGALCAMMRPALPSARELLEGASHIVVLEGITDTSNVGAIFRNAAALGADGVIVAPTCADPMSRRAVRVSMGNVFLVPWTRAQGKWPEATVGELEKRGFECLALALADDAVEIQSMAGDGRNRALFFGSEGKGLSDPVLRTCKRSVIIPMHRGVDSLNVAASSAIAMWELFR